MSRTRKIALLAVGYLALFIVVYLVALYLTFDANTLKPVLEQQAAGAGYDLEIQDLSLHGLLGLDVRGLSLTPQKAGEDEPLKPFKVDRLILSPSITAIPAMLSGLRSMSGGKREGRLPPLAFSIEAWIGKGKLEGDYKQTGNSLKTTMTINDLPLDRITLFSFYMKGLEVTGVMNAKLDLDMEDLGRADTWNGRIEADIDNLELSDLEIMKIMVTALSSQKGTMIADIESGVMTINPVKLQGGNIQSTLIGTISLKEQLHKSYFDVSGPFKLSEEFKQKNSMISGMLPPSDTLNYKGTLDVIFAGG